MESMSRMLGPVLPLLTKLPPQLMKAVVLWTCTTPLPWCSGEGSHPKAVESDSKRRAAMGTLSYALRCSVKRRALLFIFFRVILSVTECANLVTLLCCKI